MLIVRIPGYNPPTLVGDVFFREHLIRGGDGGFVPPLLLCGGAGLSPPSVGSAVRLAPLLSLLSQFDIFIVG